MSRSMNWIIPSLILCCLLIVGLAGSLMLFLSAKKEIRDLGRRCRLTQKQWEEKTETARLVLESHEAMIGKLESSIADTDRRIALINPSLPPVRGMNLNKRAEALRMARRGVDAEQISTYLHLPHSEVQLLLKIHGAVIESA